MATQLHTEFASALPAGVACAIDIACARIAPAWPLDRMIAVNPWWGFVDRPIAHAAADLASLSGATLTMPRAWYRAQHARGVLSDVHLARAIALTESKLTVSQLRQALAADAPTITPVRLLTDVVDHVFPPAHHAAWKDVVVDQVSQTCGAWFGDGQSRWPIGREGGLYGFWRRTTLSDAGVELLMGQIGLRVALKALPEDPWTLIRMAIEELGVPAGERSTYFTALLLNISGWASVCAFHRWDARLAGRDDSQIVHLLAVRLAWELVLHRTHRVTQLEHEWSDARRSWSGLAASIQDAQSVDWVLQTALELGYQESVHPQVAGILRTPANAQALQAVFCIDVRSEVYRRALEAEHPDVQTLGFAGFFGLPIAYAADDTVRRPQLPGLLAAQFVVREEGATATRAQSRRQHRARLSHAWKSVMGGAATAFAAIEATGLASAVSLVRNSMAPARAIMDPLRDDLSDELSDSPSTDRAGHTNARHLVLHSAANTPGADVASSPDVDARARLVAGILRGMSLTRDFARVVLLVGHGASTTNNPQAAGLACGACGGQSGEINARVLATLLNDADVRAALVAHGIIIPETTYAVPALHDTVTDEITLYDLTSLPASHRADVEALRASLAAASVRARRERAPRLGLDHRAIGDDGLAREVRRRADDWSEVRPEWGLARNAAFIVAPRARTSDLMLHGRAFLHEYRWEDDTAFQVLEQILTAPMVVTNWINLQYYASTVDPRRYGSGDKVLHNVVGGNVGVFEGAGGDLRIGLALQSVHDGTDWIHEPLRLSVYVEAPAGGIDLIIAKHEIVRQLVEHSWLHLFRIDPMDGGVYRRRVSGWLREA